jgi:hypothetical protein
VTAVENARRSKQPRLYSWSTSGGAGGVTSDKSRAVQHVNAILTSARSGGTGTIDLVKLDLTGRHYLYLAHVAHARHDAETGDVAWAADEPTGRARAGQAGRPAGPGWEGELAHWLRPPLHHPGEVPT